MIRLDREPPVQQVPKPTGLARFYPDRQTVLGNPLNIEVKQPPTVIRKITTSGGIK